MRTIESPTQTPIGNQILSAGPRKRIEIVSSGIDEALQGVGSSPFGGLSWTGLRIPSLATPPARPDLRYLFLLCSFSVSEGEVARVVGFRHGWSLGFFDSVHNRIVEQDVISPWFKGNDFNVSWHLRKMLINEPVRAGFSGTIPVGARAPLQNLASIWSPSPALLFQPVGTVVAAGNPFYATGMTAYVPPNAGRPWGVPAAPEYGTFNDLKTQWRDGSDWASADIPIPGPARVAFFASVAQSNIQTRVNLTLPATAVTPPNTVLNFPLGLSPEEQFLQAFPNAIPWRVCGALCVEFESFTDARIEENIK
jgi:hypothetical protein